ncbi:methionine adenosyltransferase 2 subunit beta-like [Argiope bruennichi]|uniref:methionine adenosyltransferase 2 subunit beta-like n=1 Tax=Argiope bruennichi TaxID=94029 RepID=UPI0024951E47|nr:methionine adenosyltransferase 2 subunit beta-like [Argiope bruennichi]XP_055927270.1 methionine adenosyltransferase 2 subunit beta-like [Argiope bruennichi]XP_055927272.1 methionine adenosyltransferase 2 subunit beta-like [Argiope bruennichi]
MNVIVTGASGLLGRAVVTEFTRNSWKVLGLALTRARNDLMQIDLTNIHAISAIVREFKPHAIIHCAAEKSPDKTQMDPDSYYPLNVTVPGDLAKLAAEVKAVYVFISTDYVFSGDNPPYAEDRSPDPLNICGIFKVEAERIITEINPDSCILRIPMIYGGEETVEESSISSLINSIRSNGSMEVSNYEIIFPSHTTDIAFIIYQLVLRKLHGTSLEHIIYHWSGAEVFTKYQMSRMIAENFGLHHNMIPYNLPSCGVPRPRNVHLSCERLQNLGIRRHTRFEEGIQEFRKFFQ